MGQTTGVLVLYEGSRDGHAALRYAHALAREWEVPLTVLASTPIESLENGCLRCRPATARWNEAMCEVTEEELAAARSVLGNANGVNYLGERGRAREAIAIAVDACGADLVVVAGRRWGSLRALRAARLRPRGCELIIAPPARGRSAHALHARTARA